MIVHSKTSIQGMFIYIFYGGGAPSFVQRTTLNEKSAVSYLHNYKIYTGPIQYL